MLADGEDPANLHLILQRIDELQSHIEWFDALLNRRDLTEHDNLRIRANRLALRLSRLLTLPISTAVGRYGQDSYGISTLAQPVPLLASLQDYRAQDADALEARLLKTRLMRVRHMITDALETADIMLVDLKDIVRRLDM